MRKFAIVTGASTGIGLEIAKLAAEDGYDLLVAADTPFVDAAPALEDGVEVQSVEADLATDAGRRPVARCGRRPADRRPRRQCRPRPRRRLPRPVAARWRHVIDTNITGTLAADPAGAASDGRARRGQVLITGSIAGHVAGSFQAVYNGSKAFVDSFAAAHRQRTEGQRRDRHLPQAGRDRDRISSIARAWTTPRSASPRTMPADVAKTGWEAMKTASMWSSTASRTRRRLRSIGRVERGADRRIASQDGRARKRRTRLKVRSLRRRAQGLEAVAVDRAADLGSHDRQRFLPRKSAAIWPIGGERVVEIAYGDDPRLAGDCIALETSG